MSRRKDNYETSRWLKFKKWVDGETDLLSIGMEPEVPVSSEGKERRRDLARKGRGKQRGWMDPPRIQRGRDPW